MLVLFFGHQPLDVCVERIIDQDVKRMDKYIDRYSIKKTMQVYNSFIMTNYVIYLDSYI